jgi:hypothetical protein
MNRSGILLTAALLVFLETSGCGGNRQLQSITVSPATADGQSYPRSQVQFTAMGTYSDGSSNSSLNVLWSIGNPFALAPIPCCVSLSATGLAQCAGYTGTLAITATAPATPTWRYLQ